MNRRNAGLTYAGVTSALLIATWFSWRCCETLYLWIASWAVLGLAQVVFLVIAARMKYILVVVSAASILLAVVGFALVLFTMPS